MIYFLCYNILYAMKLDVEKVKNFARNEGIEISDEEANLFVTTIKENCDDILDGYGLEIIESKKNMMSPSTYDKLLELFNEYKKFID